MLSILKENNKELYEILSNSICKINLEAKVLLIKFKDTKFIEKFNTNSDLIIALQELIYEYLGQLFKIDVMNEQTVKRVNIDERKLDLKNRKIVKFFLERYNAVIEEIEIF